MNPFAGQSIKKIVRPAVYIAGPFFNARQQQLVIDVEEFLRNCGYDYYSPFSSQGRVFKKVEWKETAEAIFGTNVSEIEKCDVVLAVLDYLLPEDQQLVVVKGWPMPVGYSPVKVPDSGTIWELGFACAKMKPIVGFTTQSRGSATLNLMLTQSLSAMCFGFDELGRVFRPEELVFDANLGWKGGYV